MSETSHAPWYSPVLSLRWRLAVVYCALFSIFVTILSIFIYSAASHLLLQNAQISFPQHAQELRTLLTQDVCDTLPPPTLASFLQQHTTYDIDAVYLLDTHGKVIASSGGNLLNQSFRSIDASFVAGTSDHLTHSFQEQRPGLPTLDGLVLPLQAPVNCLAPQRLPSSLVALTGYDYEQDTLRNILFMLGFTSVVMVIVGALVISFFTEIMFKPLRQITRATKALASGNLQKRVPLMHGHDELSELAISFNQMADRIEQMFAAQQASERRARRFVSDASHGLRTPITSLRGFTEVLIRGAKDDPATAQRVLGLMKIEAERMTQMVNDLFTLTRLDEGLFPAPTDLDLVAVVVECLQEARQQTPDGCRLALELATQDRLRIRADQEQIQQLLRILLKNAINYGCTGEQKRILLRLDKKAKHALIQVVDNGIGIKPDDLLHIFDRFYRGENAQGSTNPPIPGTGLGLPIALAIAHAYQGTLTAYSEPNAETVFTASFLCVG